MTGVIKDWLLIWMSANVFAAPVTVINLAGYFVAFIAVCFYNSHKLQQMKNTPKDGLKSARSEDENRSVGLLERGEQKDQDQ